MRLIDAEALEKIFEERIAQIEINCGAIVTIFKASLEVLLKDVKSQPTIEAKPVVHAHWIVTSNGEDKWVNKCSACGGFLKRGQKQTNFCPNCGAEMPGGRLKNNTQKMSVDKSIS